MSENDVVDGSTEEVEGIDEEKPSEETITPKEHRLPLGSALNSQEVCEFSKGVNRRLAILVGESESGKTTLLASIYEKFQLGKFSGYMFSGSKTLPAFEERCHLARAISNRDHPDTERTKGHEFSFLHFRVRKPKLLQPHVDVLFADFPGEMFEEAKDSTESCKELHILSAADHILMLIDGAQVIQPLQRNKVFTRSRSLLLSCLEAEVMNKQTNLIVLLTKWDLITQAEKKQEVREFFEAIAKDWKRRFKGRLNSIQFESIAARPENSDLNLCFGLEKVFENIITVQRLPSLPSTDWAEVSAKREIDKYKYSKATNDG